MAHSGGTGKSALMKNATVVAFCPHCDLAPMMGKGSNKAVGKAT